MRKYLIAVAIAGMIGGADTASAASIGLVLEGGCLTFNGALICDADLKPTGTGVFDPFLRTNPGGNLPVSSGWNTDAHKQNWTQLNDADDAWTSALALTDIGLILVGGVDYRAFDVDINQQGKVDDPSSLLSLTHFQLYSCASTGYTSLAGCTSFYNLFGGAVTYDASGRPVVSDTTWVDFDYRIHNGSGSGDITVYIRNSDFLGAGPYISLLDGWGNPPGAYADNDGFQEWAALEAVQQVPEPSTMLLCGTALSVFAVRWRARRKGQETAAA